MERIVNTIVLVLAFVLVGALCLILMPRAHADGEIPTGLVNECGVTGLTANHVVQWKSKGHSRDITLVAFDLLWMSTTEAEFVESDILGPVVQAWFNKIGEEGLWDFVLRVYDEYSDPATAFQKERLACEKRTAGEM